VKICRALDLLDRPAEEIESMNRALSIAAVLAREDPANPACRRRLGMCHHVLGNLYDDLQRPADAAASSRRALAIREALVHDYPNEVAYRNDLKGTRTNLEQELFLLRKESSLATSREHSRRASP
jgi:hypothetical protein